MRLEAYKPIGNDLLVQVLEVDKTKAGVLLPQPQRDRIMQVLKTGPLVDGIKPGDWVLIGPHGNGVELPFIDGDGEKVLTFQTSIHSIIGTYEKAKDEDKVFMSQPEGPVMENGQPGPSNIIDNPGIDQAPFLNQGPIGEA